MNSIRFIELIDSEKHHFNFGSAEGIRAQQLLFIIMRAIQVALRW